MSVTILKGDCREILRELPPESVHCVVTSPPYWGLRDYGTAIWQGGDAGCDHKTSNYDRGVRSDRDHSERTTPIKDRCKCGARRIDSQIGLEPTYQEYIANMVEVFREVRQVLRKDGTLWLNLGDSYAGGGHGGGGSFESERNWRKGNPEKNGGNSNRDGVGRVSGLKPKDLCGIPWRVAFALQADGWYLRQDIIWSKPNPMPESVTDRCTKAHEYLFLLSKSERYYYDAEAIKEQAIYAGDVKTTNGNAGMDAGYDGHRTRDGFRRGVTVPASRNKRSVWEIATSPFSEAHFATFPPALIEPCVLAGTSATGCCAKCGAPWMRRTKVNYVKSPGHGKGSVSGRHYKTGANAWDGAGLPRLNKETATLGWSPSCACSAAIVSCTVLDPFGGAGTTGLVADRLGLNAILIELNSEYSAMAVRRIKDDAGMFAQVDERP